MRRICLFTWLATCAAATALSGQEIGAPVADEPWWFRMVVFVFSLPYTLYNVFVDGERMHLLPAPLLGAALCIWSFLEWRRQRFWTPRIVHIMAVLALATIILINVDWVMAGGEMWTQRYVVIAIFGLFPYLTYLVFLGPKFLGRKKAPREPGEDFPPPELEASPAPHATWSAQPSPPPGRPLAWIGTTAAGVLGLFYVVGTADFAPEIDYITLDSAAALVPLARSVDRGEPDAEVTIAVFGDYQCPACAVFATRYRPELEDSLVATGQARLVYYDLPLTSIHSNAFIAARAGHCAEDQGRFWEYHDELYRQQEEWAALADPAQAFGVYAGNLGLDAGDFLACLSSDRHASLVNANERFARTLNVNSTPSILILVDGARTRRSPRYTYRVVSRTVEEVLASAGR